METGYRDECLHTPYPVPRTLYFVPSTSYLVLPTPYFIPPASFQLMMLLNTMLNSPWFCHR